MFRRRSRFMRIAPLVVVAILANWFALSPSVVQDEHESSHSFSSKPFEAKAFPRADRNCGIVGPTAQAFLATLREAENEFLRSV